MAKSILFRKRIERKYTSNNDLPRVKRIEEIIIGGIDYRGITMDQRIILCLHRGWKLLIIIWKS